MAKNTTSMTVLPVLHESSVEHETEENAGTIMIDGAWGPELKQASSSGGEFDDHFVSAVEDVRYFNARPFSPFQATMMQIDLGMQVTNVSKKSGNEDDDNVQGT